MLNADRRHRVTLRLALLLIAVLLGLSLSTVLAGVGPANRGGANIPGQDFTIYRTVNTLSCHPQYPYPVEIPLYTVFAPTGLSGRGYCVSFHSQANPNFVGVPPGQPGWDGQGTRPAIPYRHYIVMEFPNPNAGAASGSNGRWVHWEGLVNVYELAVGSGKEIWYTKDFIGEQIIGGDIRVEIIPATFLDATGQPQQGAFYSAGVIRWRTCISWAGDRRPGDEAMPCFDYAVDVLQDTPGVVWLNPNLFPTIPHDRYGKLTDPTNIAWARCLPEAIAPTRATSRVYPVTPAGCDYPTLTGDPSLPPFEGYLGGPGGVAPPTPTPLTTATATVTPTPALPTPNVPATATPTPDPDAAATPVSTATTPPTATIPSTATAEPTITLAVTATPTASPTPTRTVTPTATPPPPTAPPTITRTPLPNQIAGLTATASENASQAGRLLDGLTYTRWETGWTFPSSASFTLNLGSVRQVDRATWQIGTVSMAQSFTIQVSNDNQTWETVATLSAGQTSNAWQARAIGRQTQYIRWLFSNPTNNGRLGGFSEVQLFGP